MLIVESNYVDYKGRLGKGRSTTIAIDDGMDEGSSDMKEDEEGIDEMEKRRKKPLRKL